MLLLFQYCELKIALGSYQENQISVDKLLKFIHTETVFNIQYFEY